VCSLPRSTRARRWAELRKLCSAVVCGAQQGFLQNPPCPPGGLPLPMALKPNTALNLGLFSSSVMTCKKHRTSRRTLRTTNILAFPFHPLPSVHLQNNLFPLFLQQTIGNPQAVTIDHLILYPHDTKSAQTLV
jgi:hypothetical protein